MHIRWVLMALLVGMACSNRVLGQDLGATAPVEGLRDQRPEWYALTNLRIVVRPGETIENGTILIQNGRIVAVGSKVEVPVGTRTYDHSGHTAYAGFIDAFSETETPDPSRDSGAPHWNGNVMPQRRVAPHVSTVSDASKLRSQGITMRLIAPEGGIIKGESCVVLCADGSSNEFLTAEPRWQHLTLTVPRRRGGSSRDSYPNSPMGATALVRQSFYDAQWYLQAKAAHEADQRLPSPKMDVALEALSDAMQHSVFVFDAANERMAQRATAIAKEFQLRAILRGSGREYRELSEVVKGGHPLLIPVDFPDAPKIESSAEARGVSLVELLDWEFAPSNPARLVEAGATICLTTDGLSDVGAFLKQVRKAVGAGLKADDALAAMTTVPAKLLGIDDVAGSIQPGSLANLLITSEDLFAEKCETLETWVAGKRFEIKAPENESVRLLKGDYVLRVESPEDAGWGLLSNLGLTLQPKGNGLQGSVKIPGASESDGNKKEEDAASDKKDSERTVELASLTLQRDRLSAVIDFTKLDPASELGKGWLTLLFLDSGSTEAAQVEMIEGSLRLPNGQLVSVTAERVRSEEEEKGSEEKEGAADTESEASSEQATEEAKDGAGDDSEAAAEEDVEIIDFQVVHPLGAYGVSETPKKPGKVLFRGATVWTSGPQGRLERADVLVENGKIAAVGVDLVVPENCEVIDVSGKHLTPGLIDCHSHMATDGGVNESGQAITAEVRIADFVDNSDISIYRQLAGGLTTANVLHGSANPIGGQNQVVKLRWGASMDEMRFEGAPAGIKFALGENVKRRTDRYPNTRMGVEQIIRDQFLAAREYMASHEQYRRGNREGLPPRVDLQMEALAEILTHDRWVHCHSYRQDEIVALLDVLDEFGVQIGSLQHILEGYKVADRMKEHGATASSFSDWWAYKFEVYDAIPYNGALMHDVGIVVSFNSDDAELARHMNTEAAKAVKYGGVSPEEALKFVTLNPAKQLRIDDRVGSIEVGKDADLVIWSRDPLSTMTRCEQTWIDGRRYFSLEEEQELRKRDAQWHAALVQKAIGGGSGRSGARKERVAEEDRWHRYDIYCGHHDHDHEVEIHQHDHQAEELQEVSQ